MCSKTKFTPARLRQTEILVSAYGLATGTCRNTNLVRANNSVCRPIDDRCENFGKASYSVLRKVCRVVGMCQTAPRYRKLSLANAVEGARVVVSSLLFLTTISPTSSFSLTVNPAVQADWWCKRPDLGAPRYTFKTQTLYTRVVSLKMSSLMEGASWTCLWRLKRERENLAERIQKIISRRGENGDKMTSQGPSTLIVLAHGLSGTQGDLLFLKEAIESADAQSDSLVLLASRNEGKTTDGVANGGCRLAAEIIDLVENSPSLTHISLVGNSLGGLYSRYAAALLYTRQGGGALGLEDERICGLLPRDFVSTASPHLGVRRFTYIPVPDLLHGLAPPLLIGQTGSDLFLSDAESEDEPPLLVQMGTRQEFLQVFL